MMISDNPNANLTRKPDPIPNTNPKPNPFIISLYTVSQKNVLTLKRYSSKLQGVILMKFGRNIQNTLEWSVYASVFM